MKWTTKWPEEEGIYWFYGYRYGQMHHGLNKKVYALIEVMEISDSFIYGIVGGCLIYKSETEEAQFQKAVLPEPP